MFKSGSRHNIENYRPINILSVPSKIFESIVAAKISESFRHVITSNQHGFCAQRSTLTNLFTFTEHIIESFEEGFVVHAVYTDFRKAFDTVDHSVLKIKLSKYGIRDPLLSWLYSYIDNRVQSVVLKGVKSTGYIASSGVPQGSIIGPLLFNIFINDIVNNIQSNCLLYADDLKVYKKIRSHNDIVTLQSDIHEIEEWCTQNNMKLNADKCKVVCFSRKMSSFVPSYILDALPLEIVDVIKDLGVLLDSKLSFHMHIDFITSKTRKLLGCLKRWTADFKDIRAILILYNSLVRSNLEYNSIIWCPYYNIHITRLEAVQDNF